MTTAVEDHDVEPRNGKPFSLLVATPSHCGNYCSRYLLGVVSLQRHCLTMNYFEIKTTEDISNIDSGT